MSMELIETIEVGAGGAASIEFTSIPQDGVDLLLVLSGRSDSGFASARSVQLVLNSLASQTWRSLSGDGSSASSTTDSTDFLNSFTQGGTSTANTFSSSSFYFPNYTSSNLKTASIDNVTEANATAANQQLYAWSHDSLTAAITSIALAPASANFVAGSTASLYKIS